MHWKVVAILFGSFVFGMLPSIQPAHAASVNDVLGACDRTPGCGYSQNKKNGDVSGCSKNACFYCPADGKRQCFSVGARANGKGKPGRIDVGGINIEPRNAASSQKGVSNTRKRTGLNQTGLNAINSAKPGSKAQFKESQLGARPAQQPQSAIAGTGRSKRGR